MSVALSRPSFVEIWLLVNMWVVWIAHIPSRSSTFSGTVYRKENFLFTSGVSRREGIFYCFFEVSTFTWQSIFCWFEILEKHRHHEFTAFLARFLRNF